MKEREDFGQDLMDIQGWRLPQYKKVVYSDACQFAVNQRKKKVFRRRGRDPDGKLYQNRLDKVYKRLLVQKVSTTIAAMVGRNYKSKLAFLPRHIDGDDYIEYFLDPIVRPFFKQREEGHTD
jgi:hypothetical protein